MGRLPRTFAGVATLASVGFVLSLVNQLLFSYYFGTSAELDAYWLAISIIQFATFYMGPAREAIVPEFSKRIIANPDQGRAYFSTAINLIALPLVGSAASLLLGSRFVSDFLVSPEQRARSEGLVV